MGLLISMMGVYMWEERTPSQSMVITMLPVIEEEAGSFHSEKRCSYWPERLDAEA